MPCGNADRHRRELAALTFGICLELVEATMAALLIAQRVFLGSKRLGLLQFLGDDLLDQTLGISLVVDRKLLGPGESFGVL